MKIHLKQITPGGLHLTGEEDCPFPDLEGEGIRCAGPLSYDLDVGISEGSLWANGTISQPVELQCVSCLQNFVHKVVVPAFALHTELHGPETIDVTPLMREDILLNLPAHPHCDRDGERVCQAPHAESSEETEAEVAERKRQAAWAALDKLNVKKK